MFGYIKPDYGELKVKEYELYRAAYCGVCRAFKENVNCVSRLTLSYDLVFLALFRMSVFGESGRIEKKRCFAHPTRKRPVLCGADQLSYSAKVNALLTYHKIKDDIADEWGIKKAGAVILSLPAKRMRKKALPTLEELDRIISDGMHSLSELEKSKETSPDMAAEEFGKILSSVFSFSMEKGSANERIASELGRHMGRFIYLMDAVDDFDDDLKKGAFNPFVQANGGSPTAIADNAETIETSLKMELSEAAKALELIDFSQTAEFGEILKNIVYLGLVKVITDRLGKKKDGMPQA